MADNASNDALADGYLVRLNGKVWGIALGLIAGLGLFIATNILWLKDGEEAGQHLGLLGHYFLGYDVNFVGSLIGFVLGLRLRLAIGWLACTIYNLAARR